SLLLSLYLLCFLFFFSSRRRHTRSLRDWSSDVCSSDLKSSFIKCPWRGSNLDFAPTFPLLDSHANQPFCQHIPSTTQTSHRHPRSEERRVGKECRSRWSPHQ